jgi:GNAT superfamily N-acetyltransferase
MVGASLDVRPAREHEARACRLLVPALFSATEAPDLLVAVVDGGRVVGAAALGTIFNVAPGRRLGFPCDVHVVASWRRRGVGRALVEAAVERCRGRAPALLALEAVDTGSDAQRFLEACGFDRFDQIRHFECDARSGHDDMARLMQRLNRGKRILPQAVVVPLAQAPRGDVARMIARHFGAPVADMLHRLEPGAQNGLDSRFSGALMVGGALKGLLAYRDGVAPPTVELWVVEADLRGGWASAILLEWTSARVIESAETRIRFFADERIAHTISLAHRLKAVEGPAQRHYRREIPRSPRQ